ncbi:MAG: hypothetical protein R3Y28_08710 [Candidatus Gastranaerophilales bacterium]
MKKLFLIVIFILGLIVSLLFAMESLGSYRNIKILNCYNGDTKVELFFNKKKILQEEVNAISICSKNVKIEGDGSYLLKINDKEIQEYIGYLYDMSGFAGFSFKTKTYYIIISSDKDAVLANLNN